MSLAQQNINQDSDSEYPAWYAVPEDGGVYNHPEPGSGQFSPGKTASTRAQSADPSPADRQSGGFGRDFLGREPEDIRPDWAQRDSEADADVPDPVRNILSSSGRKLSSPIKDDIEEKMGESFNDVRIHTGPEAAEAAEAVNARAFTAGNHIVFNSGEFRPDTPEGKYVLAHEMAHVTQQTGGALSLLPKPDSELKVDPDQQLEREADQAAREALSDGENPQIQSLPGTSTDVHIQRIPENKVFEALALFQGELEDDTDHSDHREAHNKNQLNFLHDVAQNLIEKQDHEDLLEIKQEAQQADNPNAIAKELAQRGGSIADVKGEIDQLQQQIDANLEDVALTDDQRNELSGRVSTDNWDEVSWGVVKGILSATGIGALLPIAEVAGKASGYDSDEYAEQLTARIRQGEISSWEDVKQIFYSENGDLKERAEKIEKEIREGVWESGVGNSTGDARSRSD